MKQILKYTKFLLFTAVMAFVMTSCDPDEQKENEPSSNVSSSSSLNPSKFVGTWEDIEEGDIFVLNADGSGELIYDPEYVCEWWVKDKYFFWYEYNDEDLFEWEVVSIDSNTIRFRDYDGEGYYYFAWRRIK